MEVEIVSKEFVKPSSLSSLHPKTHHLNILDHFFPPIYVPIVLFYGPPHESREASGEPGDSKRVSEILKRSLSETLDHFYTFAGRMSDDCRSIDCECVGEDVGLVFYEAKANFKLSEYLANPDYTLINRLIPPAKQPAQSKSPAAIFQLTRFACGGFSICAYSVHAITDGVSISVLLKHWAATAARMVANEEEVPKDIPMPSFEAASQFPCIAEYPKEASMHFLFAPFFREGKCGCRRFVFDSEAIAQLKARVEAEAESKIERLSRIEVVSAVICKSFAKARGNKSIWASHLVDLRKRAVPPLPDNSIGNFIWQASIVFKEEGKEEGMLASLVTRFREAMAKINGDFIKGLQGEDAATKLQHAVKEIRSTYEVDRTENLGLTSWSGLGIYEVDFGWGKPAWITPAGPEEPGNRFLSVTILVDTADQKGVEAWVKVGEEELQAMENDEDLRRYASINPSPHKLNIPKAPSGATGT
ncbi:hypothetical protein MLD38_001838 [Melastoma candidum]|uniref:Uncharacterized protein n=1 Tax=Melastoma candidum TaxID=119954 RepID=A0ACB9SN41_9MYRT|nr:hypothetical protein MLD38_001838 [Melastoma candidum]